MNGVKPVRTGVPRKKNGKPEAKPRNKSRRSKLPAESCYKMHGVRRMKRAKARVTLTKTWHLRVLSRLIDDCAWTIPSRNAAKLRAACSDLDLWDEAAKELSLKKMNSIDHILGTAEAASWGLLSSIVKKLKVPGDTAKCANAAIEDLRKAERQCSEFNRSGYKTLESSHYLPLMKEFISKTIGESLPSADQLWRSARHGPGAVCGQVLTQGCSKYAKYSEPPYSVTSHARKYAVELIRSDERWMVTLATKLQTRKGELMLNSPECESVLWEESLINVPGNRITTVQKDRSKDRPIAIEPTLNVMLQLGVDGFVRKRLKKRWGLNLNSQVKNQELAKAGSVNPNPDSPATIDLSMASDTVSLRIVKMLFPAEWYEYLTALRSPSGTLPDGTKVRYSKLSSMGNGATFAIESLIFSAVVYAVVKNARWRWKTANIAVYGDDLVLPRVLAPDVMFLLRMSGFSPNIEKSFTKGPVRESCGTDWYRAYPVRGVFLKGIPEDIMDLFHAHNALWLWSVSHSIPLDATLAYLKAAIVSSGFGAFTGPADPERTDQYLFDPDATTIKGVAKRMTHRDPSDFMWATLLASLSPLPENHQFDPLKGLIGSGTVFTSATRREWHYVTYTVQPSAARSQVNDHQREFSQLEMV